MIKSLFQSYHFLSILCISYIFCTQQPQPIADHLMKEMPLHIFSGGGGQAEKIPLHGMFKKTFLSVFIIFCV